MTFALVNGALVEEEAACVSINDRGLRFGDGLFETIPVHNGLPYLWEYHLERLTGGLDALHIRASTRDLLPQALMLLKSNAAAEGLLRIQISRGAGSQGYLPVLPPPSPTVILQTSPRPVLLPDPVTLWLSSFEKIPPRALPTRFKLAQGLNSTLARIEAQEHACSDALLLCEKGYVSESASANIFWLRRGRLHTPSLGSGALAGITRRRIMELSPYPVSEGNYTPDEMTLAEAVILTNATHGAIAVARLLPMQTSWDSAALAAEINILRNNDIRQYSAACAIRLP